MNAYEKVVGVDLGKTSREEREATRRWVLKRETSDRTRTTPGLSTDQALDQALATSAQRGASSPVEARRGCRVPPSLGGSQ